ncbi:MAG: hypothetical protein U5R31_07345 [Acidimicrobiia bacterium]|nr:hypothetical protein [Acidimicrobiia bacterium]
MLSSLIRRRWPIPVITVGVVVAIVGLILVTTSTSDDALVVYNGRSHYGDEQVFADFEEETGIEIELRGGTAPELYDRLRREGEDTPADLLITTDLANLWRAEEAGMLAAGVDLRDPRGQAVPDALHDPEGRWWALEHPHCAVPVVSTERVAEGDGHRLRGPRRSRPTAGRTCLRTSTSEYNQSLVADLIAKRGRRRPPRSCCDRGWTTTRRSSTPTASCWPPWPAATATSG